MEQERRSDREYLLEIFIVQFSKFVLIADMRIVQNVLDGKEDKRKHVVDAEVVIEIGETVLDEDV